MYSTIFVPFLFLAIVASKKEAVCPPERDIEPCTCQIVTPQKTETWMNCGYISSLHKLTTLVKRMEGYEIDKFVLEQSDVGYIPSNLFLRTPIKEIIIKSMTLDNIGSSGERAFQGLEKTLESIAIRRCRLNSSSDINWSQIDHIHSLDSLELYKINMSGFPARWFRFGSKSLRYIYLMENGIKEIDENAFSSVTGLVLVDLSENKIKKLGRSMFPMPAEMLTYFNFNDNEIGSLPEDLFSSMTALKRVNFANNELQTIDGRVWRQKFSQLNHLDLLGNKIQCDCHLQWTVDALKPNYYYGECENAKDGETKKLSKIYVWDLTNAKECTVIVKRAEQKEDKKR